MLRFSNAPKTGRVAMPSHVRATLRQMYRQRFGRWDGTVADAHQRNCGPRDLPRYVYTGGGVFLHRNLYRDQFRAMPSATLPPLDTSDAFTLVDAGSPGPEGDAFSSVNAEANETPRERKNRLARERRAAAKHTDAES